jgi:hypothetical protein
MSYLIISQHFLKKLTQNPFRPGAEFSFISMITPLISSMEKGHIRLFLSDSFRISSCGQKMVLQLHAARIITAKKVFIVLNNVSSDISLPLISPPSESM